MPGPHRPRLTDADRAEWAAYVREIRQHKGQAAPTAPTVSAVTKPAGAALPPLSAPPHRLPLPPIGVTPAGLDRATWNRFRAGSIPVARTLDLHGRTAQHAYHALRSFLIRAHADRLRCVDVITGRGSGESGGVLRRELPVWLNLPELRPLVLAATHPHANLGAVRLLLRRTR
jgi:DNA-nicking Smr family endonuclease